MDHLGADQERYEATATAPKTIEAAIQIAVGRFPDRPVQELADFTVAYITQHIRAGRLKLVHVGGVVAVEKV